MLTLRRICLNCGSSPGLLPQYLESARALGRVLATERIEIVFGGANVGLMGAVADAALGCGGRVIGVIPKAIAEKVGHKHLTELHVVSTMHERKHLMFELSDAFIALPGGMGTVEEVLEILTWAQLGFHGKPCALLDICGYYEKLLGFLDHAVAQRFVRPEHRGMVLVADSPVGVLALLRNYTAPKIEKWLDRPAAELPSQPATRE